MRAIRIDTWTAPDRLQVVDAPAPVCGTDDVLIRVHAAPVSFALSLLIQGKYQRRPDLPFVPGNTVAGEVVACGSGVARFRPGERVVASLEFGGLAEYAAAPAACTYSIPDSLPFAEATAFNTAYNSALAALTWPRLLAVAAGETVLILGAAGNVGTAATEIARACGATVIAAASTPAKRDWALRHGAHHVVAAGSDTLAEEVRALTAGTGVDAVLDPVGGALTRSALSCLRPEGRLLPIGFASGEIPQIPANIVMVKNLTICGLYMGFYKIDARARHEAAVRALFDRLGRLHRDGAIRPDIAARFPLDAAAAAFAAVLDRGRMGHVVVTPQR